MPSPFPGMDPYLELPDFWSEVHHRLVTAIAIELAPPLRPKYQVAIEKRTYLAPADDSVLVGIPDATVFTRQSRTAALPNSKPEPERSAVTFAHRQTPLRVNVPLIEEIQESFLEIREGGSGVVITVVEILSPKNKRPGEGRMAYDRKRQRVLSRITHLVEIDLLRGGEPMALLGEVPPTDYRILISRGDRRPTADLYAFDLSDPIPVFSLPLQANDAEPIVDVQRLLGQVYDQAGYDLRVDYGRSVMPPLSEAEAGWVDALLRQQGLRAS